MDKIKCTLDTIIAQEELLDNSRARPDHHVSGAMREAIETTRGRIDRSFSTSDKIPARLRA